MLFGRATTSSQPPTKEVRLAQMIKLLYAFYYAGPNGLTDEEAWLQTNIPIDACWWHRCSDLREEGLIVPLFTENGALIKRLSARTDRSRMVCRITEKGIRRITG